MDTTTAPSTPLESAALTAPFNAPPSARSLLAAAPATSIEDITWLDRETCVVTWVYAEYESIPVAAVVSVDFEGADRSVGINESYFTADGDAPSSVLDAVAEEAMDRAIERHDAARDDAYDCRERDDGYRYADESAYGGGEF